MRQRCEAKRWRSIPNPATTRLDFQSLIRNGLSLVSTIARPPKAMTAGNSARRRAHRARHSGVSVRRLGDGRLARLPLADRLSRRNRGHCSEFRTDDATHPKARSEHCCVSQLHRGRSCGCHRSKPRRRSRARSGAAASTPCPARDYALQSHSRADHDAAGAGRATPRRFLRFELGWNDGTRSWARSRCRSRRSTAKTTASAFGGNAGRTNIGGAKTSACPAPTRRSDRIPSALAAIAEALSL